MNDNKDDRIEELEITLGKWKFYDEQVVSLLSKHRKQWYGFAFTLLAASTLLLMILGATGAVGLAGSTMFVLMVLAFNNAYDAKPPTPPFSP